MAIDFVCNVCNKVTTHNHCHNSAYGMAGTHMQGTERYECKSCGKAIYKDEGIKQGLKFILD